jgi:hypothetical protein
MARVFVDEDLLSWEAYASTGRYSLPERPRIVFNCLSDPNRPARYVVHSGDNADAEGAVLDMPLEALRELLDESQEVP